MPGGRLASLLLFSSLCVVWVNVRCEIVPPRDKLSERGLSAQYVQERQRCKRVEDACWQCCKSVVM